MSTTPTQIRLTDEDKANLETIRRRYGLPSAAAAVRLAIEEVHQHGITPAETPKRRKAK